MKGGFLSKCRQYGIRVSVVIFLASTIQACGLMYPNRILDASKDATFNSFLDTAYQDFVISPGDILEVYIFPNGGYNLIEAQIAAADLNTQPLNSTNSLQYSIDQSGIINLPRIGEIKLGGLTEMQAEQLLSQQYIKWYNDPFVNVYVTNKYVTVFRGSTEAKRITLDRPGTTLLEVIGMAGGIPDNGKSEHVKIIRKVNGTDQIQELDLSDVSALAASNCFVRPGDVVYVEPGINAQFFREIAPIVSTFSGIAFIYAFFVNVGN